MPHAQISSYSKEYNVPKKQVEIFWNDAKEQYGENWAAISGTVKKMCKNYKHRTEEKIMSNILKSLALLEDCGCDGKCDKKKCKCGSKCKCKKGLKEGMKEKMECSKCDWKGTMADVHTDRGGHNFTCPKCKAIVKSSKLTEGAMKRALQDKVEAACKCDGGMSFDPKEHDKDCPAQALLD